MTPRWSPTTIEDTRALSAAMRRGWWAWLRVGYRMGWKRQRAAMRLMQAALASNYRTLNEYLRQQADR